MSTAAPTTSNAFTPISGIRTRLARKAPTIDPKVLKPYTMPIARSPVLRVTSMRVMSGSVIPAQNVAGSITARQMKYRATANPWYPASLIPNVRRMPSVHWNDIR
jgi:hypothetical protein